MLNDLKTAASRNPVTLAQDFAGAAALVVVLISGLLLPGLV